MRRSVLLLCISACFFLCTSRVLSIRGRRRSKRIHLQARHSHNVTKKSTIETFHNNCGEHQWKKSVLYGQNNYADVEKHKRGFLANLANLLNDAELMAARKNENGLTAINQKGPTLDEVQVKSEVKLPSISVNNSSNTTSDNNINNSNNITSKVHKHITNHTTPNSIQKEVDSITKEEDDELTEPYIGNGKSNTPTRKTKQSSARKDITLPTPDEMLALLNDSGEDFAPIFAMYHGRVIPLGKLPETAFTRKFISPVAPGESFSPLTSRRIYNDVTEPNKVFKDVTGSKRNILRMEYNSPSEHDHIVSKLQEKKDLHKLAQYLKSLDDHPYPVISSKDEPTIVKDVRDVAKDVVVFPDTEEQSSSKTDLFNHVKSVVLDNGNILSVKHNYQTLGGTTKENIDTPQEYGPQKFFVTEDGTLAPVVKRKPDIIETVPRDMPEPTESPPPPAAPIPDSQKTVSLTLDVLKELLRKTGSKVSIDSLLNRKSDRKVEPAVEPEETAAPDMLSKKTDSNVSLADLLNKKPEVKSETGKDSDDEDPGTIEDFAAGGLKAHNDYRTKHHDEPLVWSDDIAAKAQKLAESLADKKTLEIAKDLEKEGYGENVAKVWATFKNAGEAAAKMWYTQSDNYHFDDPHLDENTGQFAQVVWKSTKELGMGVAKSIDDVNNKYVYVTALYRPPGNVESILRENVLPTGNNTVDVYTTFFKRAKVVPSDTENKKQEVT